MGKLVNRKCKVCPSYHTGGIKDGKHDHWCCHYGKPAIKSIGHCNLEQRKKNA